MLLRGAAPHDLGSPREDPVVNPNQYDYQDVSNWRDLNSKYVLMVWRDYVLTGSTDEAFLRDSWAAVKQAMEHLKQYDTDGDGLISVAEAEKAAELLKRRGVEEEP